MFRELLGKSVSSESRIAAVASLVLYVAGVLVLFLCIRELSILELTAEQLFLGMLGALGVSLQIIILGFLVDIRSRLRSGGEPHPPPPCPPPLPSGERVA